MPMKHNGSEAADAVADDRGPERPIAGEGPVGAEIAELALTVNRTAALYRARNVVRVTLYCSGESGPEFGCRHRSGFGRISAGASATNP
jgi:hypothetical protein